MIQNFRTILIAFFALFFIPIGAAVASPTLVGTYAIMNHGKLVEFIRVEKSGPGYVLFEKQSGKWRRPVEVKPASESQLEAMLKHPVTVQFTGLTSKKIGIFQVPKGWKSGKFVCSTGYWLATVLGPVELHKQ
ncbi:hypothetical protein [Candidatus Ferrigenium straubiae]|uniref:hypothetical protein n=1 Tax=Candidatus Ferrigenium straubiae TaxID=2919506 RepID=UPI003F4AF149